MSETTDSVRKSVYSLLDKYNETFNQVDILDIETQLLEMKKDLTHFKHKLRNQLQEYFLDKYPDDIYNENKESTSSFELSPNQRFLKKFMSLDTRNRSLLLFHGVGVGKTCASVSIAENFHNTFSNMKKTIVLSNKVIRHNFENELYDLKDIHNSCVGGKYIEVIQDWKTIPRKLLLKRIKKNIDSYYDFKGYIEFSNEVYRKKQKLSDDDYIDYIQKTFSDRLIIIDEVHNLRSNESSIKKIPILLEDIIKFSSNLRLLYLSATPMFDDYSEIIWLFNTLYSVEKSVKNLPPNVKLFNDDGEIFDKYKKRLIRFANNHISYMRGENPFSFPLRLFPSINNDTQLLKQYPSKDVYNNDIPKNETLKFTEIVESTMSKEQYKIYNTIDYKKGDDTDEQDENNKDMQKRIQLSNIYFPNDGSVKTDVGKKGLLKIMDEKQTKTSLSFKYKKDSIKIFELDKLQQYSPKIKTIIDYVKKSTGIVIIYSKFIHSGIIPLALSLESAGFSNKESNLLDDDDKNKPNNLKYSIISGDSRLTPSKEKIIDTIRSYENRNGDLIKVVLISQVATEGVDFKNVREIHLLEPWFNMSKIEQIIGRGVRRYSHINLDPSERNSTIYLHANVLPKKQDRESVDLRMYRISELKQQKISQIERILKEGSVDCNLNENVLFFDKDTINKKIKLQTSQGTTINNYELGDIDYSKLCDFQKCKVECIPKISKSNNTSKVNNFNVLSYEVNQYVKAIIKMFKNMDVMFMTYDQLRSNFNNLSEEHENILHYALSKMIDEKITFKFREVDSYIVHNSNKYIVHPSYLYDQKVSLNLRHKEYLRRPNKLHLKNWKGKVVKQNNNNTDDNNSNNVKPNKPSPGVIKNLDNKWNDIKKVLLLVYSEEDLDYETIWSMIIDKLNIHEHKDFVNYFKKNEVKDKYLRDSLEDGLVYYLNKSNKLDKLYDFTEKNSKITMYNIDGKEIKMTQGQIAEQKKEIEKNVKSKMDKIDINNVLGFTEFSTNQKSSAFKMKNTTKKNNTRLTGAICLQTSQFNKNVMIDYIKSALDKDVYDKISVNLSKLKKLQLCVLYEYNIRNLTNKYLRPILVKVYQDIDKKKN